MADFVSNSTQRYRIRYRSAGFIHTMLWRFQAGAIDDNPAGWADKVGQVLGALGDFISNDFAILAAEAAEAGSDVFLPSVLAFVEVTGGVNMTGQSQAALSLGFVGRSALGQRARMFVYGIAMNIDTGQPAQRDWRIGGGEDSRVSSALSILNALAPECVATDGGVVQWYPYMNLKFNDYWVRRQRS